MSKVPLPDDYRSTPYDYPNRKYQCANANGGPCDRGPDAEGNCCGPQDCQPKRSQRHHRKTVVTVALLATLSVIVVSLVTLEDGPNEIISAGPLSKSHATLIEDCSQCHAGAVEDADNWLRNVFASGAHVADSAACLKCHDMGETWSNPHGLGVDALAALTRNSNQVAQGSWRLGKIAGDTQLACADCHREHRGREHDLQAMTNQQCQTCHVSKFDGLADGHPAFVSYPYNRRTRIQFDHVSHLGKHFRETSVPGAPADCADCHTPDTDGGIMKTASFEQSCASCHGSEIREGDEAVAFLGVPGLDLAELKGIGYWPEDADEGLSPMMRLLLSVDEETAADVTALEQVDLMDLGAESPETVERVERLAWAVKRLFVELEEGGHEAFADRLGAVFGIAGESEKISQMSAALPRDAVVAARNEWFPGLRAEWALHAAGKPVPDVADSAAAEPVAVTPPVATSTDDDILGGDEDILGGDDDNILGGNDNDILGGDDDDILGGNDDDILGGDDDNILGGNDNDILGGDDDDILGGNDDDILGGDDDDILGGDDDDILGGDELAEEVAETSTGTFEPLSHEAWMKFGGWYRSAFSLYFRPSVHADKFMHCWMEVTSMTETPAAKAVFADLTMAGAPGACVKCHSVDHTANAKQVNWHAREGSNKRQFTRFSHTAHFGMIQQDGCTTCHQFDVDADYQSSFQQDDPHQFISNFVAMKKEKCATCHTSQGAGDGCLECHNYHIGIDRAMPNAWLQSLGKGTADPFVTSPK